MLLASPVDGLGFFRRTARGARRAVATIRGGLGVADNEPLSYKAVLDAVMAGCKVRTDAFYITTVQFLATAANYFKVRAQEARSLNDASAAAKYDSYFNAMAGYSDLWTHRNATCDELGTAVLWFLQTMGDDPRDETYVAMNHELRGYYAAVRAGEPTIPDPNEPLPEPEPLPTSPVATKTPWLAIGGVLAGVAIAGTVAVVLANRKKRRR